MNFVEWQSNDMEADLADALKALANDKRLQIMGWLVYPTKNFRAQVDGDLEKDGVCGVLIAEKLGVSQSTASVHLRILTESGLLTGKKIKQWVFYRRNEKAIAVFKNLVRSEL